MPVVYGSQFTITTGDVFLQEKWSKELTIAREAALVMGKWVKRFDVDNADILNIPNLANLAAAGTIDAHGDLADVTPTTDTNVQLLLNQRIGYILNIPDELSLKSQYDLVSEWTKKAGYGIGLAVETNLLGLTTGFSQTVGDTSSELSALRVLRGVQRLNEANAPKEDRHLVIDPSQVTPLLDTDRFISADKVPYGREDSPILHGEIGMLYGGRTAWSTEVVTSALGGVTGFANLMFHKDAAALGILRDVKSEELARTHFARRIGCSMFYGFIELRDNHGVLVYTSQ